MTAAEKPMSLSDWPKDPTIYSALAAIQADVTAVQKTERNEQQGYAFRGIGGITAMLHPLLAKHGVFVLPIVEHTERSMHPTKSGGSMKVALMTVRFRFMASDGSYVDVVTIGEGADSGDKASNKAMTAAQKYALTLTFTVPFEDQEDGDRTSPEAHGGEQRAARSAAPESSHKGRSAGGTPPASEPENPPDGWRLKVIGFGKHKGTTWGNMAEGSLDGERYGYLVWLRDQIREALENGTGNPKYADRDREQLRIARAAILEIEARHDANLPPPEEGRSDPNGPPPMTDEELPF
jgi:hypothetical protein